MPRRLRPYRAKSLIRGQTSPPQIGHAVAWQVEGDVVADVGCGSGVTGYLLRSAWQFTSACEVDGIWAPTRLIGIDWSESTLEALERVNPYDELMLASSAGIPLRDGEVDTAISMENLEHLLPGEVPIALAELARIARRKIVISTPAPWYVTNVEWLTGEITEAEADPHPMGYAEYMNLVGFLHKSSVTPGQMAAAGFRTRTNRLGAPEVHSGSVIYTAAPGDVDVSRLGEVVGVPWDSYPADDGSEDWREPYLDALRASLGIETPRRPTVARRLTVAASAVRAAVRGDV